MKDELISRKAAIDECNKRGAEHIGYAIAHLPSAHCDNCPYPDQHVPQEDAVSRKELKHIFETWLTVSGYNDSERNMIKAVLYELQYARSVISAQPKIVPCKDCRYHIPQYERCRLWCQFVDQSEWCSRAVRKDGETDEAE